ncbi:MAG: septation protein IspZ [Steroidobacterales bacterium]
MSVVTTAMLWVVPLCFAWIWRPRQGLSPGALLLLIAYGALGAWALWFGLYAHAGEPAGLAVWKPTVLYWTLAAVMIAAPLLGWGYPVKIIVGAYFALSSREWRWINRGFATVYIIIGGANLAVASEASYKDWVGFKYACMMNLLIIILFRLNFVWLPILADVSIHLYRRTTAAYRYLSSLF